MKIIMSIMYIFGFFVVADRDNEAIRMDKTYKRKKIIIRHCNNIHYSPGMSPNKFILNLVGDDKVKLTR